MYVYELFTYKQYYNINTFSIKGYTIAAIWSQGLIKIFFLALFVGFILYVYIIFIIKSHPLASFSLAGLTGLGV